ncbi:tetrameric potassium-selective cyclic nucleotide gated channel [Apostichopus japonicus]|uniref:Tetrameric potassium-selective cyclic nucleotide gated channel n=1 Tax=Stichopus japonicus TaxID=307972 RepID=A0A2G8KJI8_STIJA|nr:tetrameric potassium-selective cyclic nucleotide gated channel [Apostichopus japonicus]
MTSTGYGDISANTTLGRFIALVAMLIGLLLYGYCLSSIAATLANTDTPRVRFQEKLFVVQEFMKDHGVSPELNQSSAISVSSSADTGAPLQGLRFRIPAAAVTEDAHLPLHARDISSTRGIWVVRCISSGEELARRDLDEALTEFPLIAKQFKEAASNRDHLLELKSASQRQEDLEEIADTEELEADRSVEATSHRKTDTSVKVFNKYSDDYLEPFKKFSPVTRLFLKLLMSRVFLPSGRYFQLWEGFRVAISLLSVFTVTIQASFLHTSGTFWGINYFLEITFYIDMYLKFHSAFFNENKVLVTHPVSTAKHYFKTNFLIDLMACFPTELIAYCFVRSTHEYALHIYAVVRLNRLIQFYRVPLAFNYLESGVEMETGNIRKWKFFFYLVLFMHILACVWYFSACQPLFKLISDSNDTGLIYSNHHFCHNSSWTSSIESFDFYEEPIITQYFISLYWAAATGASVGYGDIVAKTQLEMVLALSAMIFGIVFFGYVIASVAASLANADAQRARYQEKLTAIGQYLKDNQVEKGLAQRVLDYYNYMWLRTKGVDTDSLFDGLPLSLKADVSLSLYQDMINNVPLFQNTEVGFQKMLAMCIKPDYYLSKEYIVKKHDFGKEMFFIHRGVVDVVSEDGQIVFDTMQAGRFFGEISLVYSCPRTASIRAQTNCDCFVLTKEDLDEVLTHYPSIKVQINQVAEERINAVRKRSDAKDLQTHPETASRTVTTKSPRRLPHPHPRRGTTPRHPRLCRAPSSPASSTSSANNLSAPPNTNNIAPSPNTNNNNDTKTKAEDGKSQNGKARGGEETSEPAGGDADGDHPSTAFRQPFPLCCFFGNKNYVETILRTNHFVLSPESPVVRNLSRLTCALAFVLTWTIIYQSAFQVWSLQITLFSYLCELVFLFEIYIKFHVSCADEYGELEKDFNKVYTFYLKKRTGFRLDLVAALPLDIFALCFPLEIRLIAYTFLRWVHLLRLFRVSEFFENWEKELNINMLQVRLTKTFVTVVVIIHFFASLWYFIACPPWEHGECLQGSWASALIIASLVMVIGQLLNGSVLGNIASTLANEEAGRVEYEERLDAVKEQMKDMKLNSKLRNRVISYFDYLWMRNKGVDQHTLLRDAPFCLQTELALNINEHHLTKVPIFKDAEASFFRSLSLMLRPVLITPNDYIVRQGDVGDEMYFIHRGTVEVMDENNLQQVAQVLHEGDHFDDINLLYDVPRRTSVRACTHVNLQALSVHDLKQVLAQFPSVEEQVCRIGRDLYGDYAASVNAQEHFPKKFSSD